MKTFSPEKRAFGLLEIYGSFSVWVLVAGHSFGAVVLPGTQPKEHDFRFRDVANCALCHSRTTNGLADPYFSWQGGMMAQAARDPVFRAALAIANQDIPGVGEFCIRCHSPRAWLEGRSSAPNASLLKGDDLHGVSCDVCHHLVDPLSAEAKKLAKQVPPGYGNGMIVADPERILRGPYDETKGVPMHATFQSAYHASSELCGNCHNVSNPTLATNVNTQPPHAFGHIERTYSEWALSDFAKKESLQTCQSCHFPRVPGGGKAVNYKSGRGDQHRDYFVSHSTVGGSTWVQDAIFRIWGGQDLDRDALEAGKKGARQLLKKSAVLGLELAAGKAHLTVTNLSGHKLPTGYPEGRRMWINVRFLRSGLLLGELGRYGTKKDYLDSKEVNVPTLRDPDWTRVYECKPGISEAQGAKSGKPSGPSFHFILNDVITKDNRIPPRGYRRSAFEEHLAAPVGAVARKITGGPPFADLEEGLAGADYADGQYWDELEFVLPTGTAQVEVRLMYQSVSWEYLKFLVEENHTDDWGRKLYDAWAATGQCPPEEIAFVTKRVKP
jgi:cytochrome c553